MDDVVDKIIALDKEGQAQINALEKEKRELSSYTKKMRVILGKKYDAEAVKKAESIKAKIIKNFEERVAQIESETVNKQKNIDSFYELQKEVWLKQLVEFCLKD